MTLKKSQIYGIIDIFSIPVSLFSTRRRTNSGSLPGLILSLVFITSILSFITIQFMSMIQCEKDKNG